MFWIIAAVLVVLWFLGFIVIHISNPLLHILLVIALIVIIFNLISGRSAV